MGLAHEVNEIFGGAHYKVFTIDWNGIHKEINFTENDFIPSYIIWSAFKRGVEAERDRTYAITGEWPLRRKNEKDLKKSAICPHCGQEM